MDIQSTRFGTLAVDDERVITFPNGLLGFPEHKRFALIQTGEENYFVWLQSVDEPNLAFVVADPGIFFKGYEVPLRDETRQELALADEEGAERFLQVFVICNKVGEWLTGNLLGPLVVNASNRLAQQVVLTEKKWTTRQPLLRLESEVVLAKAG
jgi:flagellar assembly factor FliW